MWVADVSDKVARRVPVTTGSAAAGGLVEVNGSGLTVASRVIARGFENLSDGDRIHIATEDVSATPAEPASKDDEPMSRMPNHGA